MPQAAHAQSVLQVTNTTDSTTNGINSTDTPCTTGNFFVRDFNVTSSFSVQDVKIGVLMAHTYRSDMRMWLRSPSGIFRQIFAGTGGNADNFNILFSDSAAAAIGTHTANDTATPTTIVPTYQRTFQPANSLNSTYVGQDSFGIWQLWMCDAANGDSGTFYQADLFLTTPPPSADLSLIKTVASASPSSAVYTLSVTNSSGSQLNATGVSVRDILPSGVSFVSASGTGTYNSGTGIWTIGSSIAPGQTVSINLNVNITAVSGTSITNIAEVWTSATSDPDSTPANGVTSEDDYASNTFTVGGRLPGIAPNINSICTSAGSPGTTVLDWNNHSWTPGSSTGSANVPQLGTVNFNITTQGVFDAPLALTTDNTGGLGSAGLSLFQSIQYSNINEVTTTVITLPNAVSGVQFTVFDVDFAVNDFADKLTVTGSYNGGLPSNATLTNGAVNYISGNAAIGDGGAGGTTNDGNVTVTFSTPVDTITLVYGNHTTAPADPDGQAISIHDFTFCRPFANLSVTKISNVVSDGVSASNPKAIPGAVVQYCILVSNAGTATATNVTASDNIPSNLTYVTGSMRSGANCASATTVEDENNTGADDTDAIGMSISGTTLTGIAPSLAPATNMALVFNTIVN